MSVAQLDPRERERLMALPLTYPEVGATAGSLPSGYRHLREAVVIGTGRPVFEHAARDVMTWQVQSRSGIRVGTSDRTARVGAVVDLRVGPRPVTLHAPCRVVHVLDEPARQGFAYGTLPSHPASGEEAFVVALDEVSGEVTFRVVTFSRLASWPARLGEPVSRAVQLLYTRRYLRSLR